MTRLASCSNLYLTQKVSIIDILPKLESKVQQKFLSILFSSIIVMCGKVNFRNLSRYSEISERTYRRQFSRSHNFIKGNAEILKITILPTSRQIIATDCSFIKKSGKETYGIEYFYNGSAGKVMFTRANRNPVAGSVSTIAR